MNYIYYFYGLILVRCLYGAEPATFRLVAQCLRQLHNRVPPLLALRWTNLNHAVHYIRSVKFSNVPRQRRQFLVPSPAQTVTVVGLESQFSRTVISPIEGPILTAINLGGL